MHIVDTNMILRYALKDHPAMYAKAQALLEDEAITIPLEIVAEVVSVLEKVYHTERAEIQRLFLTLANYGNLTFPEREVLLASLSLYCDYRVDYIDAVLGAYQQVRSATIHTFDQPLQKLLRKLSAPSMNHDTSENSGHSV